jgi:flagellar biosynthesis/type III secretory pathway protein FliH
MAKLELTEEIISEVLTQHYDDEYSWKEVDVAFEKFLEVVRNEAHEEGREEGLDDGIHEGYNDGRDEGYSEGYDDGYEVGFEAGQEEE